MSTNPKEIKEITEKLIEVRRVAKVVKGGRRFGFSALVVAGDGNGYVGAGMGKASEVTEAVRKAGDKAKKNMVHVAIDDRTVPHEANVKYCASKLVVRPAPTGAGIIACGPVRAVIEASGIKDINIKSLGSSNSANLVQATIKALKEMRSFEQVSELRGKQIR